MRKIPTPLGRAPVKATPEMPVDQTAEDIAEWEAKAREAMPQVDTVDWSGAKATLRELDQKKKDSITEKAITDTWLCLTFDCVEQREAFLAALKTDTDLMEYDGREIARRLGIELPEPRILKRPRPSSRLAALSLPVRPLGNGPGLPRPGHGRKSG